MTSNAAQVCSAIWSSKAAHPASHMACWMASGCHEALPNRITSHRGQPAYLKLAPGLAPLSPCIMQACWMAA